jgi:hypothetical protein
MPVIRILLDNNVPIRLIPLLRPHEAVHASKVGWAALGNGDLIRASEEHGYPVLVTSDQNIRYQQNLTRRQFSIVERSTTRWPTIRDNVANLLAAIETITPGSYTTVTFPRPPLRRRPYERSKG